jgi:hypothetical protein
MRLELVERLRCPRPHEPTPLIVLATEKRDRELVRGEAGCPVCHLRAQIVDGDARFEGAPFGAAASASTAAHDDRAALDRLEALLGLSEPGARVLLTGRYARLAAALARDVDAAVVSLNAAVPRAEGSSSVHLAEPAVPFTDATFNAIALDADVTQAVVTDALRALATGGRVLGKLPLRLPASVRELARDTEEWVGEKQGTPAPPLPLRRA